MSKYYHLVSLFICATFARDIRFPPIDGSQTVLQNNLNYPYPEIDISTNSAFAGLNTFGNTPYVNCFASHKNIEKFDIAIIGAPFDTATTGRPGARFGPVGIRQGSRRINPNGWNVYTGENVFMSWAKIIDCGDPRLTYLDNTIALKQLEKAHRIVANRQTNSTEYKVPRLIALGGDHTTTLAALRSTFNEWGVVNVIHFDSHIDTWDPLVLGGGLSEYAGVNHGTFLHIAHEEGLIGDSSMHVGIRAPLFRAKDDLRNDMRCGFDIIKAREIDYIGVKGIIEKVQRRVGDSRVYISVDIDVLDPAYAPATGTPEVGGWSTRELLSIIDGLRGLNLIGADVVEVAPAYDNKGETTTLAAAEIVLSLAALMVQQPVAP